MKFDDCKVKYNTPCRYQVYRAKYNFLYVLEKKIVVFAGHCNAPCWNKYEFVRTKYNGYHI